MTRKTTMARAAEFDAENPEVWRLFHRFTFEVIHKGHRHFGALGIIYRIRWETTVNADYKDGFKVNNNHACYYARKFMGMYPEREGFFRTREVQA